MADDFDYNYDYSSPSPSFSGTIDFSQLGQNNPYSIPSSSSLNLSANDPASAYWQPDYNTLSGINPQSLPSG